MSEIKNIYVENLKNLKKFIHFKNLPTIDADRSETPEDCPPQFPLSFHMNTLPALEDPSFIGEKKVDP